MDVFTKSYIKCALWASSDQSDEQGGESFDVNYSIEDIDPTTLRVMQNDCEQFQRENAEDIATWESPRSPAEVMAGHDFWLSRNGYGAGFYDGDWPEEPGKRLSEASERFGEFGLYLGDNGTIYH